MTHHHPNAIAINAYGICDNCGYNRPSSQQQVCNEAHRMMQETTEQELHGQLEQLLHWSEVLLRDLNPHITPRQRVDIKTIYDAARELHSLVEHGLCTLRSGTNDLARRKVRHDMRNTIGIVFGFAHMLSRGDNTLTSKQAEAAEQLCTVCKAMLATVDSIP